jgi:hypothetical protein
MAPVKSNESQAVQLPTTRNITVLLARLSLAASLSLVQRVLLCLVVA